MPMPRKWGLQPHLSNVYWLKLKELERIYPEESPNTLKGKKAYWSAKIKEGKIPEPPMAKAEQPPISRAEMEPGRLAKTWEAGAFDQQAGEWNITTLHSYDYTTGDPSDFEPVEPARIRPTKRRKPERIGRTILVFGDSQIGYHRVYDQEGNDSLIPTHSEEALSILAQINAQEMPDEIVNLSDTVDFAELGRFDPQSDSFHRTLSPALRRAHDLYAQLRADNPEAKITEVDSNHTTRVHKAIMKRMPELYGMILPGEDYPLMSYYRLANLAPLGINFISGYGAAEYVYGEENGPPIVFKHGTHSSSSPGATVRKEAQQNPTVNVVRGHGHSYEHITQTTREGRYLHYVQLGTTCQTTGNVPSYHSAMDDFGHPVHNQENWQQQLMMIHDFEDGSYQFDTIDIINGIANYKRTRYDGNPDNTSQ